MKKTIVFAALAVLSISACSKLGQGSELPTEGVQKFTDITVKIQDNAKNTKAGTDGEDGSTGQVTVLVFDGSLSVGYGVGTTSVTINSVPMNKTLTVYAIANCSTDFTMATADQITAAELSLTGYLPNAIPMYASESKKFTASDKTLTLSLRRAASKVKIDKITAAFESPYLKSLDSKVTSIYIYNAPGNYKLSLADAVSPIYYHKTGYSPEDANTLGSAAFLIGDTGLDGVLTNNATYSSPHYFWFCPSSTAKVYLTIEVTIGGIKYYYGVPIDKPEVNKCYTVTNAKITGLGSTNPPGLVDNGSISLTINVSDWGSGFSKEVTF